MKRFMDLVLTIPSMIMLTPVFIIISVLVKLDSRGPIIFRQFRMGKGYREFEIYKFRTMTVNAEKKGPHITVDQDIRITRIGKYLRRTKLDELPQLINVLKGDMSLVGPRPEVKDYTDLYYTDYLEILRTPPGITDLASLKFSDEEKLLKNQIDAMEYYKTIHLPKKIELAKKYLNNKSIFNDLIIILKTLKKISS